MVKINLLAGSSSSGGGGDLAEYLGYINVKHFFIALIIFYVPGIFLPDYYQKQISHQRKSVQVLDLDLKKAKIKINSLKKIAAEIKGLKEQENILADKLKAVKAIINQKSNPFKLFVYLLENIPKDIWIEKVTLVNSRLEVVGNSYSWPSIQKFLDNMKKSIFIRGKIDYEKLESSEVTQKGVKVLKFKIKASTEGLR